MKMRDLYLGINSYSHDSSACLMDNEGNIIAAVEEERFTGSKREKGFPEKSIKYCLAQGGITSKDLKGVAIGWGTKELLFDQIIKQYLFKTHPPLNIIGRGMEKLWLMFSLKACYEKRIGKLAKDVKIKRYKHHIAHASSAFYASGYDDAAFLTIDARGERDTSLWGVADYKNGIQQKGSLQHPNSLGSIWVAISEYCGFVPGADKSGTTMAFAALGEPKYMDEFRKIIRFDPLKENEWIDINLDYFCIYNCNGKVSQKFIDMFGPAVNNPGQYTQAHYDVAATLQKYTEEIIIGKLNDIYNKTNKTKLVMAGGVCLNSVTNGLILEKTPFKEFFVQPASHDAGTAIGAAYLLHQEFNNGVKPTPLKNAYLGPEYSSVEIEEALSRNKNLIEYTKEVGIHKNVAKLIHEGSVVMWFQGRLEFGPRALGSRSILAPAIDKNMVDRLNKSKHRESFRPFAISVLEEEMKKWLVKGGKSPYMLVVDHVKPEFKDKVPAAQHIDGSVRVQSVNESDNGIYYSLLKEYFTVSGIPLFINTSLNIKGRPIVNSPEHAIDAFLESDDIKYLAIGDYIVTKRG